MVKVESETQGEEIVTTMLRDKFPWRLRYFYGLLGTDPQCYHWLSGGVMREVFTKLDNIKKRYAVASVTEKHQIKEYVQVNSEAGYMRDFPKRGYYHGKTIMMHLVWTLMVLRHLDTGRQMLCAGLAYSDGSLPGITTDQMRAVVGLPPIKGALEKQLVSKSNPKGLRSRFAVPQTSLGKARRKPKPRR